MITKLSIYQLINNNTVCKNTLFMSSSWACVVSGKFVDTRAVNISITQIAPDSIALVFNNDDILMKIINYNYNDANTKLFGICYRIRHLYKSIKKQRTLFLCDSVFQNDDLLLQIFSNYSFLNKLYIWKVFPQFRKYLNIKCKLCNKLPRNPVRINIFNDGKFKTCPNSMMNPSCKICVRRSFNLNRKYISNLIPELDYSCPHGCCNGTRLYDTLHIVHGYKTYGRPGRSPNEPAENFLWTEMDKLRLGLGNFGGSKSYVSCPKCEKKCNGQLDLNYHIYHICRC